MGKRSLLCYDLFEKSFWQENTENSKVFLLCKFVSRIDEITKSMGVSLANNTTSLGL